MDLTRKNQGLSYTTARDTDCASCSGTINTIATTDQPSAWTASTGRVNATSQAGALQEVDKKWHVAGVHKHLRASSWSIYIGSRTTCSACADASSTS